MSIKSGSAQFARAPITSALMSAWSLPAMVAKLTFQLCPGARPVPEICVRYDQVTLKSTKDPSPSVAATERRNPSARPRPLMSIVPLVPPLPSQSSK